MTTTEVHTKPTEFGVYTIPGDTDQPMRYEIIGTNLRSLQRLVGGGYIEIVRRLEIGDLPCGCDIVMVVDEEGLLKGLPGNLRAGSLARRQIVGDVFLIAEGPVIDPESDTPELPEPDFYGLPATFRDWEGPGSPIPLGKQPWED